MDNSEFRKHVDRLKDQYGERMYSSERLKGIWDAVEHLSEREWDRVVTDLIASCLQPPLLQKIREAIEPYKHRIRQEREQWVARLKNDEPRCALCGNSGAIQADRRGTIYSTTFRCPCAVGDAIGNNWEIWSEARRHTYEPHFVEGSTVGGPRGPTPEEMELLRKILSGQSFSMPGYTPMPTRERERRVEESKRKAAGDFDFP